jgi:hypothetical protein
MKSGREVVMAFATKRYLALKSHVTLAKEIKESSDTVMALFLPKLNLRHPPREAVD